MKKIIKAFDWLIIILIIAISIVLIVKYNSLKFDNETPKNDLLTKVYNEKHFSSVLKNVDSKSGNVKIHQLDIKPQCIRKTDDGGYAIYRLESGKELYIFFNEKKRIIAYTTVDNFISSDDIIQYKNGNASDVLSLGSGISITTSGTASELLIYFLTDNKVGYVRFNEIIFDGDEEIEEIIIKTNEEYLEAYEVFNWQPYILPMDRY